MTSGVRARGERVVTVGESLGVFIGERSSPLRVGSRVQLSIVNYFRAGSAGSRLTASDLPEGLIRSAGYLHVSGITPGLSRSARDAVARAVAMAHEAGAQVSLDVNYRAMLWSVTEAGEVLRAMLDEVDVVFGGEEELCMLVPGTDVNSAVTALLDGHPSTVVCTRGAQGATAFDDAGRIDIRAVPVTSADPVGAGDAFVAGFLSAQVDGLGTPEALARAAECGAFAASVRGDWEGLPRRDELGMLARAEQVQR